MSIVEDKSGNSPVVKDDRISGSFDLSLIQFNGPKQELTIGAASVRSTAFDNKTFAVRIAPDTDVHYRIGDSTVVALATDDYLAANAVEVLRVEAGQHIAMIQDSAGGACSVSEG